MGIQMVASPRAIQIILSYFSRYRRSQVTTFGNSVVLCSAIWNILVAVLPHRTDCNFTIINFKFGDSLTPKNRDRLKRFLPEWW